MDKNLFDDLSLIGRRLRAVRHSRNRSLEVIAGLAGVSIGQLSEIERGLRTPSLKHLLALADALQVSPSDIMRLPFPSPGNEHIDAAVQAVRLAVIATVHNYPDGQVCSVEELQARIMATLDQHLAGDPDLQIADRLPTLIRDLHASIKTGRDVPELLDLAIMLHVHVTVGWLRFVGAPPDLRVMGANLATTAAQERGTPDAAGLAVYGGLYALIVSGAMDIAYRELNAVTGTLTDEVAGSLALLQSYLAAIMGRRADSNAALELAAEIAVRTKDSLVYRLGFGPISVAQYQVGALIEAGDYEQAVRVVDGLNLDAHPFRSVRADSRVWSALALARVKNRRADAVAELKRAEDLYPHVVQRNQLARDLLAELITHARSDAVGVALRRMAHRAGVSGSTGGRATTTFGLTYPSE